MRQQKADEILKFIQNHIRKYGIAPSVREIAEGVGFRSTSTIHRYLHQMQTNGTLQMDSKKKRAIFISESAPEGIPVIAQVQPETALLNPENIVSYYALGSAFENTVFAFYLNENHPENGFLKGDLIIAESSDVPPEGKLAVFLTETGIPEITAGAIPSGGSAVGSVISMIRHF